MGGQWGNFSEGGSENSPSPSDMSGVKAKEEQVYV